MCCCFLTKIVFRFIKRSRDWLKLISVRRSSCLWADHLNQQSIRLKWRGTPLRAYGPSYKHSGFRYMRKNKKASHLNSTIETASSINLADFWRSPRPIENIFYCISHHLKRVSCVKFYHKILSVANHFCVGFPTLCYRLRNLFICRREQSVCHVVSTWREDWVPLAKMFCGCDCSYDLYISGAVLWRILTWFWD